MNAQTLLKDGRLADAIELLGVELRGNPTDAQRRTFLFELLAFAGEHQRAERQLDVLAQAGAEAQMGTLLYRGALTADGKRREMFARGDLPTGPAPRAVRGTLNGRPFESLEDADPRIGARLEVFAAGRYLWLPLEHVASISMVPPTRLRDLLWAPATLHTGAGFKDMELGEVLLPVLTPDAATHPDPDVRLGRVTDWRELPDGRQAPVGQKLLLVDGEEFPILELRELVVTPAASSTDPAAPHAEEAPLA